ncbi:cellulose binding domain-containing protein [Nonomuraea lactucae]|uniref:cellulose binding domain-containing protein n=1 Tax=Nonomuraea lactucae TaxID=2249762 RepID=UPI000DE269D6|nr:cellulose binding domain-containing protein [Nonomuraea lactucae]
MSRQVVKYTLAVGAALALVTGSFVAQAATAPAVRLQYRTSAPGAATDQSEPWFKLFNDGTAAIPLNQVKIRYYITGRDRFRFACSWAAVRCSTLNGRFLPLAGGRQVLEVGFSTGTLAPGASTGDLQLRFYRADWQNFRQNDDPSYGSHTTYADWNKVTVHVNGALAWGSPPRGSEPSPPSSPSPTPPSPSPTPPSPSPSPPSSSPTPPNPSPTASAGVLFDDFSYTGSNDARLGQRGWRVRSQKFREGTYAARVRFSDAPTSGPDGEHVVQTFFTITPLAADLDPDYGELDFEYLPNGGWGESSQVMFNTSWETYRPNPWRAVNTMTATRKSFAGWHDLVVQVSGGRIKYYIDGSPVADHGGVYYPETPMWIMFNQWFIDLQSGSGKRCYRQQVDWVYHSKNEVVAPADVVSRVAALRSGGTSFRDTVPTR